jgi:hypothetical protein
MNQSTILADAVNVYARQALDARKKLETIKIAMIDNLLDLEEIFNLDAEEVAKAMVRLHGKMAKDIEDLFDDEL